MTREDMAEACEARSELPTCRICGDHEDDESHSNRPHCFINDEDPAMIAAAAELRKKCGTCANCLGYEHDPNAPEVPSFIYCRVWETTVIPADGSGFCHAWEAKP